MRPLKLLRRRSLLMCAAICSAAATAPTAIAQPAAPGSKVFGQYAVAADHPLASAAGAEILAKGGNAVDAAVATSFALSVVRPFSCGIGGGGFMVIYLKSHPKQTIPEGGVRIAINYRETAPAAITSDFFEKLGESEEALDASVHGGKAIAIPGTVAGLLAALDRYGTLDRATVMAPAIKLAGEGFAADAAYAKAAGELAEKFRKHPDWKERFAVVWQSFLHEGRAKTGDRVVAPLQAQTLERIALGGASDFYTGPLAASIIGVVHDSGGVMTADDLVSYQPAFTEPLTFSFRKRTFLGMPPPSSGGLAMAETLGILERTGLDKQIENGPSGVYVHFLVESFKHAFADRAEWLGDPAFVDVPVQTLLSSSYLAKRTIGIRVGSTSSGSAYGSRETDAAPNPPPNDGGTSHLCVVDAAGNAVACTETINLEFGSLVAVGGFCLNNQMDDFTTRRGKPNEFGLIQSARNLPAPGKRPLSSMTPTIVLDGKEVCAVAGASGGPRIITATTQVLLNTILFGKGAADAVAFPRFHHQWEPDVLEFENRAEGWIWQSMPMSIWMRKCHHQVKLTGKGAAVQLVLRDKRGQLDAACDPRKGGEPAGR